MKDINLNTASFVIPVQNEQETLQPLVEGIVSHAVKLFESYEIIFIDDGSDDKSLEILKQLAASNSSIKIISFAVNQGKSTALNIGFQYAMGDIVFTMDADLQDDPVEIPHFLEKIREGYDLVSGWKSVRHDPWHKTLPSKFFNFVVSRVSGIRIHDFNCGYKAYRRQIVKGIRVYGELHRFAPVLAKEIGARITEIPVKHNPRLHGKSKYGISRLPKGFFDLLTVTLTTRYLKRPLHFFGSIGLILGFIGFAALGYLAVLWFLGYRPVGNRPLLFYGMLMTLLGGQIFSLGLVGELFVRFNQPKEKPLLREKIGFEKQDSK